MAARKILKVLHRNIETSQKPHLCNFSNYHANILSWCIFSFVYPHIQGGATTGGGIIGILCFTWESTVAQVSNMTHESHVYLLDKIHGRDCKISDI